MFFNYLKTAWRFILRTKSFSFINIFGLTLGMTACLLILHYVQFEQSYDSFHNNADRIYRLRYERESEDGSAVRFASCCPPAGAIIRQRYTQVEKLARIFNARANVSFEDRNFFEEKIFYSDPQFFEIFNFEFISGDPLKGLEQPGNAFVSQSIAKKYYGDTNPIGKTLQLDKKEEYHVAGLFKDFPGNSHIKIDILLPLKNFEVTAGDSYMLAWGHTGLYTYILLKPGEDPAAFEAQLGALVTEQVPWLAEYKMKMYLKMQPLKDIHLTSHFMQEYEAGGDINAVRYLFIIALFIIIMAWVNYVNLSTARSLYRAREVGLRKVVGATRGNLTVQFFMETVLLNMLAVGLTFLLLFLLRPMFNLFTGLPVEYSYWHRGWFWLWTGFLFIGGVFLSGFYPVFTMITFKISTVLRGQFGSSGHGIWLRKALVTFQFAMALILIVSTITIFNQIEYLRNQDLGFDMQQTLVFSSPRVRPAEVDESFNSFRATLVKNPQIIDVCHVTEVPGRRTFWDAGGIKKMGEPDTKAKNYQIIGMDYHYASVFDLEFAAGRNFSPEFTAEEKNLIFNESAVQWMGFESPAKAVGQKVDYWGEIYTIVGVLKDFHQQSLKEIVEPHIYRYMPTGRRTRGQFAVKLKTTQVQETVADIKEEYQNFFPDNPFDYFFLDEYYNQQYKSDELFGRVFRLFSMLTIFITMLGLFGLSTFNVSQRTREIGIRKALGSSVTGILVLLSQDYFKRIAVSFIIACPVAWFALNQWLDNFASRIDLTIWPFLMAIMGGLFIAIATVGGQALKAATANPVEALRYE